MLLNRSIVVKIWEKIDSPDILIVNGARQVGKTSVLAIIQEKLQKERGIAADHLHWFDLEKTDHLALWSSQEAILHYLPFTSATDRHFIFLDEFQQSSTIGSIAKVIHDHYPNWKILMTGSASWYLSLDDSLAGRKIVFTLWPLSFAEFIDWQGDERLRSYYALGQTPSGAAPPEIIEAVNQTYISYLTYGGYPRVVLATSIEDKQLRLAELLDSYIMRDVQIAHYAVNSLAIRKILGLLASQVGSLIDIPSLGRDVGLGRTALLNRLDLLQNTFILKLVKPFFTNKIKELVKNPKIYLSDTGLANRLLNRWTLLPQTADFGHIVENATYMDIIKRADVITSCQFWRTKTGQEVDLVIKRGETIVPIEVKSGSTDRLPEPLRYFIATYHPREAYVLNWNVARDETINDCVVHFRPLWLAV